MPYLTAKFSDASEYQAEIPNGTAWVEVPFPGGPITYAFSLESLVQLTFSATDGGKPPWTPGGPGTHGDGHGHQELTEA
jgi:hypothetical protein